jgi:hypothetical protein
VQGEDENIKRGGRVESARNGYGRNDPRRDGERTIGAGGKRKGRLEARKGRKDGGWRMAMATEGGGGWDDVWCV